MLMNSSLYRGALGLVLAAGALGCAGSDRYVYTPEMANAQASGLPASRTPIPQESPQGSVEILSYGVTDVRSGPEGRPVRALHVRMAVTNDGDSTPWKLDTGEQLVQIPGEGRSRAMFVNSDVRTLPNVTIGRRERRVLDLYYPLPDTIRDAGKLPRFEILWQVTTPARTVASRTAFDRAGPVRSEAVAEATYWPYWAGYGPYWWYDPWYPRVVFIHSRPIIIHRGPRHPVVGHFQGHFNAHAARPVHAGR